MSQKVEMRQPKIDLETAIRVYHEYLEDHPFSILFVPLANLYRMQGRFDDAVRVCQEGLRIFPHYFTARTALGLACHDKGDYARARTELERVVSAMPENVLARRVLGDMYQRQGDLESALAHWGAIAALFPDHEYTAQRIRGLREELAALGQGPPRRETTEELELPAEAGREPGSEGVPAALKDEGMEEPLAGVEELFAEADDWVEAEQAESPEGVLEATAEIEMPEEYLDDREETPLEESSEVEAIKDAVLGDTPPDWEAQQAPAEVSSAFALVPPPTEEEFPHVVEEFPGEEGPMDDPRQEVLSFGEGMVAEGLAETEGAKWIGIGYSPFFVREKKPTEYGRREATLRVVSELEQWLRRLRESEG